MRVLGGVLLLAALAWPAGAAASYNVSYAPGSGLLITGSAAADAIFVGVSGKDGTDPNSADPPRVYIVFGSGPVPGSGCAAGSAMPAGGGGVTQTGVKCTIPTPTVAGDIKITINAGDGDDTIGVDNFLLAGVSPASVLDLGPGNDRGTGSMTTETVLGGAGNDTLEGRDGNDRLEGGLGNDVLAPGAGTNMVFGDDGDDALQNSGPLGTTTGADTFSGGSGSDLVSYAERTVPVTVSPSAADGQSGENDVILPDVERLLGGAAGDSLDLLIQRPDPGSIDGGPGNDKLIVSATGLVTVTGGDGLDAVKGGSGPNVLNMRDAIAEAFSCGAGDDRLDADLKDAIPSDCERVAQGAILEGPNVRISGGRLRANNAGRVPVELSCPAKLGSMGCVGTLQLIGKDDGPVSRYSIRSGAKKRVRAKVSSADIGRLGKRGRSVRAVSIETGRFGDKTTIRPIVVLGPH